MMPEVRPAGPDSPINAGFNLAILASKAALALGRRAEGIDASLDSVRELATLLRSKVPVRPSSAERLLDPLTTDLLTRAFVAGEMQSLPELNNRAAEVVEALFNVDTENRPEALEKLRDFCIALSRSAQASSTATTTSAPHPFRR
jgi:hypothetical protein